MVKEIDETMRIYDRFIEIVKALSIDAEEQLQKLKGFVVADEIANDFCEIGMVYAKELVENEWITKEQFEMAKAIDNELNAMSKHKELWCDDALLHAQQWKSCREKGKALLDTLE